MSRKLVAGLAAVVLAAWLLTPVASAGPVAPAQSTGWTGLLEQLLGYLGGLGAADTGSDPSISPAAAAATGEEGPGINIDGFAPVVGDEGPGIDPNGLTAGEPPPGGGEEGPGIDPNG